jgi:hypothetical protein
MSGDMQDLHLKDNARLVLNRFNVEQAWRAYLNEVNSLSATLPLGNVIASLYALKRTPLERGPYPGVSFFEASNRILSDVTILLGVRRLLANPVIGRVELPFDEYTVALGVESGYDLTADDGACRLVGEAFNVAPSFFQTKKSAMLKKLRMEDAAYRLVVFNADAVPRPEYYIAKSEPAMLYLPVDVHAWAQR